MKNISCGIVAYYVTDNGEYRFLVGHPGGNFTKHKDIWTMFKGAPEPGELDEQCALREFTEETGLDPKNIRLTDRLTDLGTVRQSSGKIVHAFAMEISDDVDIRQCSSNLTPFGWPEIDRYKFMTYQELKSRVNKAHLAFYRAITGEE